MLLSDLTPNIKNPRKITDEKLQMLEASLKEFGDLSGFIFNRKLGRLEGGHQRQKVMPPDAEVIIEQKFDEPTSTGTVALGKVLWNGEKYAYREVEWNEPKSLAANVAANKHGGEWDLPALEQIMLTLDENNIDLSLTGFGEEEIKDLFDWKDEPVAGLTDDDAIPENVETRCQPGQLWILGNHRLLCGDSTKIEDVERLMNKEKADMVFTDPPYGLGDRKSFNDDHKDYADETAFDLTKLKFESDFVIWGANYYDYLPQPRLDIGWVVWDKRPTRDTWDQETREDADRRFGQHFEIAVTNIKGMRGKMLRKTWGGFYGVAGKPEDAIVHKTQKPIELLTHFIADDHKIILDYFGGSGSTLIACEKTSRKCFMMEIDPHYCDVIIQRWEQFTGKTAVLQT